MSFRGIKRARSIQLSSANGAIVIIDAHLAHRRRIVFLFTGASKTGSFCRNLQGRIYGGPENKSDPPIHRGPESKCDPHIDGRLVALPPDTDDGNGRNGK